MSSSLDASNPVSRTDLPSVEELEEKEMQKKKGKAFYLILNLKNYRRTLQATYTPSS
jgi:hypothetical protein